MTRIIPRDESPDAAGQDPVAGIIPAAVSLQERRPRTLKHGDTFAVFDHNGDALATPTRPEGIFYRDTRHLSRLYLTIGGQPPVLLSSTMRDDNATLTSDLANPDFFAEDGTRIILPHDLIHVRRTRFLWQASCFERLAVRNFDLVTHKLSLEIWFGSDFADVFEVRGSRRPKRGTVHDPVIDPDQVRLAYTGLDDKRRETLLRFYPAPRKLTANGAVFDLEMAPGETVSVFIEVHCDQPARLPAGAAGFFTSMRDARRALRDATSRVARVTSSNEVFNEIARRSVADLYMLITDTPDGPYPYAGIPWFSTVFGRDALITAFEMLWLDPTIARGVLAHLAALQAKEIDASADAEPGKILHEARHGEMADLGEVPFRRYYGSVDATPLFVMLAGAYLERTGDATTIRALWPNVEAALSWIERYGDKDNDGFVEYIGHAGGLANHGWKDSHDSVFYADGALAAGPIALVEVQAYVYGAWRAGARIAAELGKNQRSIELAQRAESLRQEFDAKFFDAEMGTYVLALDGNKRPCRVSTSNAGHALFTGIALRERTDAVVATLMAPALFSGWGIRTLAATEARYNPMSYHNGSVWPHDNALIASGFARYGYRREAMRIFEGMFGAAAHADLRRLPELFCGFPRKRSQRPTSYPVACSPQAWAAVAPLSLLRSCLGISFDPQTQQLTFDRAVLPASLNDVALSQLAIGSGRMDVMLRRAESEVAINVVKRRGEVRMVARS